MRLQNKRKPKSGSLAQVVEHLTFNQVVRGSSPRWLTNLLGRKSPSTDLWPRGQAVKTSPFHGGDMGSIPVGVTRCHFSSVGRATDLWDR